MAKEKIEAQLLMLGSSAAWRVQITWPAGEIINRRGGYISADYKSQKDARADGDAFAKRMGLKLI